MSEPTPAPTSTPFKTAIITGACSGIGLALTRHLLSLPPSQSQPYRWRIILADIRPEAFTAISPTFDPNLTTFIPCDVSSWSDNASLFEKAFSWSGGRIDFLAANAGTDDKERIQAQFDLDLPPEKPNLKCIDVNLMSIFYQIKLFIHYARKTRWNLTSDSNANATAKGRVEMSLDYMPKLIITASCVGQYPFPPAPQYAAAKHALVGLTRSIGHSMLSEDGIAVNCVMPAFVPTALAPQGLVGAWPKEHVTPVSTVVRAFVELISEDGQVGEGSDGVHGEIKMGCCVECAQDKLFYREHVEFPSESQRWMIDETKPGGLWTGGSGYGGKKEREGMA